MLVWVARKGMWYHYEIPLDPKSKKPLVRYYKLPLWVVKKAGYTECPACKILR